MLKLCCLFLIFLLVSVTSVEASLEDHDASTVLVNAETSFSFSPNATGYWVFFTSNMQGIPFLQISNEYGHVLNYGSLFTVHLVEGAEYIVLASFRGDGLYVDQGSYMLNFFWSDTYVYHDASYDFPVGSYVMPGGGGLVEAYGEVVISFTPDTSGLWAFQAYSDDEPFPMWIEDPFGNTLAFSNFIGLTGEQAAFTIQLAAGVEYSLRTMMLMWLNTSFSISASPADEFVPWLDFEYLAYEGFYLELDEERTVIPGGGGEVAVQGETWFSFTPDATGPWMLTTSDRVGDPLLVLTDSYGSIFLGDDDSGGDLNSLIFTYLAEGIEYVIWARFWQLGDDGSYTLTVVPFDEEGLDKDEEPAAKRRISSGHFGALEDYRYFLFTPDSSGAWVAQLNDENAMLVLSDPSQSFSAGAEPWTWNAVPMVTLDMAAGVEYMITVWLPDWLPAEGIVLSVHPLELIRPLAGALTHRMVVREVDFSFVPDSSGYWLFETSLNDLSDPYLWIFDSYGEIVAEDDDGGAGLNAQIKIYMEAGEEYLVRAGFFQDGGGEYLLSIRKATFGQEQRPRLLPLGLR